MDDLIETTQYDDSKESSVSDSVAQSHEYDVDLVCMKTGDGETVTVEAPHHSKAAPKAIEQSTLAEPSLSSTWVDEYYTATRHND